MPKKKVKPPPRVLTNKLIAYYRINGKYDTPLDSLDVQKRRVAAWVEKNNHEIVEEVTSYGDTYDMSGIFGDAYRMCGHVIIASGCRVAGQSLDFYRLYESEDTPLLTTESQLNPNIPEGAQKVLGFVELLLVSSRDYYREQCEKWIA